MKKGIIFDMDGTLWDSSKQVCEAWDVAVEKCGYSRAPITIEEMQGVMGKTMDLIAEILFPFVQGKEQDKLLEACCKEENDYLKSLLRIHNISFEKPKEIKQLQHPFLLIDLI